MAACSGGATEAPPATAQGAMTLAPVGENTHGPVRMVGQALGEVPLRPDQRVELEKLAQEAEARHQKVHLQAKDLMLAFADQVEKGKIDRPALQPKIDATVTAFESSRPADRAALERVHAILDPQQREKFATVMQAKMKEHHFHGPGSAPATTEQKTDGEHAAKAHHARGGLFAIGRQLGLTDEQRDKIKDTFKEMHKDQQAQHAANGTHHEWHGGARPDMNKVFESFKGEKFSMDEVAPQQDVKARAKQGSERILSFSEKVLPILTPEQRTIAARMIRDKANHADESVLTR